MQSELDGSEMKLSQPKLFRGALKRQELKQSVCGTEHESI